MAKSLQVVFGKSRKDSAQAVVFSLSNEDVTLTVNGRTYTVSMSVVGNDRPENDAADVQHLGYIGVQLVSVDEYTQIKWTAEQGQNSDSGDFHSNGGVHDDGWIACSSCFNSDANEGALWYPTNAYSFLMAYKERNTIPMLGLVHQDDIFYPNGGPVSSASDGATSAQGKTIYNATADTPYTFRPEYDYALFYFTWANILDDFDTNEMKGASSNKDWQKLLNSTCFMPQWGDHEFENNYWSIRTLAVPNYFHQTTDGYDGAGLNAYNDIMMHLQGNQIRDEAGANDTNANHWYVDFCGIRLISTDEVTNGEFGVANLGLNQITDILDKVNSPIPFKVICTSMFGNPRPEESYSSSRQNYYKDEGIVKAEYDRLWNDDSASPDSIMKSPYSNGMLGNSILIRGDWHGAIVFKNERSGGVGEEDEKFYEIIMGSVSNSAPYSAKIIETPQDHIAQLADVGLTVAGGKYETNISGGGTTTNHGVVTIDYIGSGNTPEMVVRQWVIVKDKDGTFDDTSQIHQGYPIEEIVDSHGFTWGCAFKKTFRQFNDNLGYDDDQEPEYSLPTTQTSGAGNGGAS